MSGLRAAASSVMHHACHPRFPAPFAYYSCIYHALVQHHLPAEHRRVHLLANILYTRSMSSSLALRETLGALLIGVTISVA